MKIKEWRKGGGEGGVSNTGQIPDRPKTCSCFQIDISPRMSEISHFSCHFLLEDVI